MKITLQAIRDVTTKIFGIDSYIASFITEIIETDEVDSVTIYGSGLLKYNPKFMDDYVETQQDLSAIILHELFHPMYHFPTTYDNHKELVVAIAKDAVINADLVALYSYEIGRGALFKKTYHDDYMVTSLLRPECTCVHSTRFSNLYSRLYDPYHPDGRMTTSDIITTLEVLLPNSGEDDDGDVLSGIFLLGDHSSSKNSNKDTPLSKADPEIISKIASDLHDYINNRLLDGTYNRCEKLAIQLLKILNAHISLKQHILKEFLTKKVFGDFIGTDIAQKLRVSPIPLNPSKRDLILMASGYPSLNYHIVSSKPSNEKFGLVLYLDVSGSVWNELPKLINTFRSLNAQIKNIFVFSTEVVEISMARLFKGDIPTSGGTDFNCVAKHTLENEYDKVVFVTDGFGSMREETIKKLVNLKTKFLTILTQPSSGYYNIINRLKTLGPVINIKDIIE
jgi:hypothetical protein